jgi:hypothetical protein
LVAAAEVIDRDDRGLHFHSESQSFTSAAAYKSISKHPISSEFSKWLREVDGDISSGVDKKWQPNKIDTPELTDTLHDGEQKDSGPPARLDKSELLAFRRRFAIFGRIRFWTGIPITAVPRLFWLGRGRLFRADLAQGLGEGAKGAFVRTVLGHFRHDTRQRCIASTKLNAGGIETVRVGRFFF